MAHEGEVGRRAVLTVGIGAAFGAAANRVETQGKLDPDKGVTAPEDLMKEHGVLNRCLLIYEEGIRRIRSKQDVPPEVFLHTAQLVRHFVEEYHEKNEENHIFPVFEKRRNLGDLGRTLTSSTKPG